jgi:hypothetical protein
VGPTRGRAHDTDYLNPLFTRAPLFGFKGKNNDSDKTQPSWHSHTRGIKVFLPY